MGVKCYITFISFFLDLFLHAEADNQQADKYVLCVRSLIKLVFLFCNYSLTNTESFGYTVVLVSLYSKVQNCKVHICVPVFGELLIFSYNFRVMLSVFCTSSHQFDLWTFLWLLLYILHEDYLYNDILRYLLCNVSDNIVDIHVFISVFHHIVKSLLLFLGIIWTLLRVYTGRWGLFSLFQKRLVRWLN